MYHNCIAPKRHINLSFQLVLLVLFLYTPFPTRGCQDVPDAMYPTLDDALGDSSLDCIRVISILGGSDVIINRNDVSLFIGLHLAINQITIFNSTNVSIRIQTASRLVIEACKNITIEDMSMTTVDAPEALIGVYTSDSVQFKNLKAKDNGLASSRSTILINHSQVYFNDMIVFTIGPLHSIRMSHSHVRIEDARIRAESTVLVYLDSSALSVDRSSLFGQQGETHATFFCVQNNPITVYNTVIQNTGRISHVCNTTLKSVTVGINIDNLASPSRVIVQWKNILLFDFANKYSAFGEYPQPSFLFLNTTDIFENIASGSYQLTNTSDVVFSFTDADPDVPQWDIQNTTRDYRIIDVGAYQFRTIETTLPPNEASLSNSTPTIQFNGNPTARLSTLDSTCIGTAPTQNFTCMRSIWVLPDDQELVVDPNTNMTFQGNVSMENITCSDSGWLIFEHNTNVTIRGCAHFNGFVLLKQNGSVETGDEVKLFTLDDSNDCTSGSFIGYHAQTANEECEEISVKEKRAEGKLSAVFHVDNSKCDKRSYVLMYVMIGCSVGVLLLALIAILLIWYFEPLNKAVFPLHMREKKKNKTNGNVANIVNSESPRSIVTQP